MSNNTNSKNTMEKIKSIHTVDGFDPESLAIDYTDMNTGETRKRLPVMAQIAWFRLYYPDGKISVTTKPEKDYFVSHARIYQNYMDPLESFLSEATATRKYDPEKPTVSPREWAQTAAIGIALRNAGFGLQFHAAGDSFDHQAVDEQGELSASSVVSKSTILEKSSTRADETFSDETLPGQIMIQEAEPETEEDRLAKAMQVICPLKKEGLAGKTLGELITLNPQALSWIANKFEKDPKISDAAKLICETALSSV